MENVRVYEHGTGRYLEGTISDILAWKLVCGCYASTAVPAIRNEQGEWVLTDSFNPDRTMIFVRVT